MRTLIAATALLAITGIAMASVAGAVTTPTPVGDSIAPRSVQLATQGQAALDKGQPVTAIDSFETALAIDPKNTSAYVGIAKAYEAQGLPGKAVKYYREALGIDPNDLTALEGQGLALVARGATARAQVNLERIKTLCKTSCPAATHLQTAMTTATATAVAQAAAAPKTASAETVQADPTKPVAVKN